MHIQRYISTTPLKGLGITPKHTLFFVEAYHCCCFLTINYKLSRKYFSTNFRKFHVDDNRHELKQLSKDYDLDFTRLRDYYCFFISLFFIDRVPRL